MFRKGDGDDRQEQRPIEAREVPMKEQAGGEVTVVGQGARLEGTVVSAGSLRIDGQVKGKITADGDVTLAPQSVVEADIHAQNVVVAGRFKGNIVARNRAELAQGGHVDGNVTSKTLIVAEGAMFTGQSLMGEQAAAQAAQPAASAAQAQQPAQPAPAPRPAQATAVATRPPMPPEPAQPHKAPTG